MGRSFSGTQVKNRVKEDARRNRRSIERDLLQKIRKLDIDDIDDIIFPNKNIETSDIWDHD